MDPSLRPWTGIDALVALAETNSFTRAADRLGVSVSHISRAIRQLEEQVQTKLVARTTRRVSLTGAGRLFEQRCRRLIEERESAFDLMRSSTDEVRGHLRITCSVAYGERTILPLINRFALAHPRLSLETQLSDALLDLSAEGIDLAIRTGNSPDARLAARWLASRSLILCAAPAYLERAGPPESLYDLHNHVCLLGRSDHWSFTEDGADHTIRPEANWRCNTGFGVLDAARQGLGICQLPDFYVEEDLTRGSLVELLPINRPRDQDIWAVFPHKSEPHPAIALLLDHIAAGVAKD